MKRPRLYVSQAILLLAVVIPLGYAERTMLLSALTFLAVLVGWQTTVRTDRPFLGTQGSRLWVILAFLYLVYLLINGTIPVMALARFMILVCIGKLLQRRTMRDDAQLFVLPLLLLVVAAIVSGNLLFPLALAIFLTVGIDAIIRFHLAVEAMRVEERNQRVLPGFLNSDAVSGLQHNSASPHDARRYPGIMPPLLIGLSVLFIGAAIFTLSPRVLAGAIGPLEGRGGGRAVTGLADTLNLGSVVSIQESDQPVMRVQIQTSGGIDHHKAENYFRRIVLNQYTGPGWDWHRARPRHFQSLDDHDDDVILLPRFSSNSPMIIQRYWIDAMDSAHLFTCYPAAKINFDVRLYELEGARKWVDDQVLQVERPPGSRTLRYTVHTPAVVTPALADELAAERRAAGIEEPQVLPPSAPLPREPEILDLIEQVTGHLGPLDIAENRLAFVRRLEEYLQSRLFTYTLQPPPSRPRVEPIGEFLLNHRRGHCEYFASALAIMCQLSGIPARIVVGYSGGEYNPIAQTYVIRQKHAHAWVEAFIPGMDWVTFDPTPATGSGRTGNRVVLMGFRKYMDYLQFQWANLVVGYDAAARRKLFNRFEAWLTRPAQNEHTVLGAVAAFTRELFGWRLQLTWRERLIYWVFSLLVVMLVVLLGYVLVVALLWLQARVRVRLLRHVWTERPAGEAEFYRRFCRRLASLGISRPPGQTPAEFAEDLAQRFPLLKDAPLLVQAYYEVFFGRRSLDEPRQKQINALLSQLREAEPATLAQQPTT